VPAIGGKYIEAVVGSPQRINPLFVSVNEADQDIARLVYSGLMRTDEKQNLIPDLAVSYEISEDKKVYTFTLRNDVLWHDKEIFNADDVVFTIETIQNPLVNSPLRFSFEGVKVEAVDDYKVKFILLEPFSPFLSSLTVGILPEHVWLEISPDRIGLAQKNLQPVGTGPYMFKKFSKDEAGFIYSYELQRFGQYYQRPPYIEEFIFRFFSEYEGGTGAISALREQKVDGIGYVPFDLKEKVARKNINLKVLHLPQYTALFFNQEKMAFLQDKDTRNALSIALDRSRIVEQSLEGDGQIINSPLLPGSPGYDGNSGKLEFSIDKANAILDKKWKRVSAEEYRESRKKEILDELKTARNALQADSANASADAAADNVNNNSELEKQADKKLDEELATAQTFYRKDGEGKVISLNLITVNTKEYEKVAQFVSGYWQEIGVKTNIICVESKDITKEALKSRSYDVLLYGMIVGSNPDQYPFWHSSQINFPGLNLSKFVNRTLDGVLEGIRSTDDSAKLSDLYKKFESIILEEKPAVFLYTPIYIYVVPSDLKGLSVLNIFIPCDRFADITNWYIKIKRVWK
jgi:peptide/nickel transport system substrate-binding protein